MPLAELSRLESSPALSSFSLIAAPFTPFDNRNAVQFSRIEGYARDLRRLGVSAVFVCGTTGEGMSLTLDERIRSAEHWRQSCDRDLRLIVHVGHSSIEDARALARHAASIGADAIATVAPCFFTAETPEVLTDYCARIAEEAPDTPFYYYHIPSCVRVGAKASQAFVLMREQIPTFAGIKFTHNDLADYEACQAMAGGQHQIFFGRDEMLIEGLRRGAEGAVGSTYNFAAPIYRKMISEFRLGNFAAAEKLQDFCTRAINVMLKKGGQPAIKATMGLCGFDCGAVRSPLKNLSKPDLADLRRELDEMGFFSTIEELVSVAGSL
jgi:N-acetylneuraminate lyase